MRLTIILSLTILFSFQAIGQTIVTSQEQFGRLMPDGLPIGFKYNFERAFLEVQPDPQKCPAASRAFFNLHVTKQGVVSKASGRISSLSAQLKGMALN